MLAKFQICIDIVVNLDDFSKTRNPYSTRVLNVISFYKYNEQVYAIWMPNNLQKKEKN